MHPLQEFTWEMAVDDNTLDSGDSGAGFKMNLYSCVYDMKRACPEGKPSMVGGSLWARVPDPYFYPVVAATPAAMEKPLSYWFPPLKLGALRR